MINLRLAALSDAERPFVTRIRTTFGGPAGEDDSVLVGEDEAGVTISGRHGIVAIDGASALELDGDVLLIDPEMGRAERLIRADSDHNTLMVTERCDQLCVMCSQPPKKTHVDRFKLLQAACILAPRGAVIGVSGGEPTLYKSDLFNLIEHVGAARPDLQFHVLTNGQHFTMADVARMRAPAFRQVTWGVPLYAVDPILHDEIVGKDGAFRLLEDGFRVLLAAGAGVELRTVVVQSNLAEIERLAEYVVERLRFIEVWSIMQLEHIGFAKARWHTLFVDHRLDFDPIARALDKAAFRGVPAQLFNFPRCSVPETYRTFARASISDWKRKYMPECASCRERTACTGFFEWHPDEEAKAMVLPL